MDKNDKGIGFLENLIIKGQVVITTKIKGKDVPILRILNNGADWTKPYFESLVNRK